MKYEVLVVGDDELPPNIDHVILERDAGPPLILINGSVARCWMLMRSIGGAVEHPLEPSVSAPLRTTPGRPVGIRRPVMPPTPPVLERLA